ncbi:glycosyl transferase group 1 [Striga asiatica]|uniref:Glycosyl transferase group 1 n=1 Tax=Striga asiatica TaxID=4170 RepID=A0A5A7PFQ3_STRAF|nr:glycosyl transferase group 1 [Striga asiatica]
MFVSLKTTHLQSPISLFFSVPGEACVVYDSEAAIHAKNIPTGVTETSRYPDTTGLKRLNRALELVRPSTTTYLIGLSAARNSDPVTCGAKRRENPGQKFFIEYFYALTGCERTKEEEEQLDRMVDTLERMDEKLRSVNVLNTHLERWCNQQGLDEALSKSKKESEVWSEFSFDFLGFFNEEPMFSFEFPKYFEDIETTKFEDKHMSFEYEGLPISIFT